MCHEDKINDFRTITIGYRSTIMKQHKKKSLSSLNFLTLSGMGFFVSYSHTLCIYKGVSHKSQPFIPAFWFTNVFAHFPNY